MKSKRIVSIPAITILLLFSVFSLNAVGATKSILPNGEPNNGTLYAPSVEKNLIFSYSDFNASNSLILNGVSVPVLQSGWYKSTGEHNSSNSNYICGIYDDGSFYHNFFAFDLNNLASYGISLPITSAVLSVIQYQSEPATGTQLYQLSAVSTSYSTINQSYPEGSATGLAIFSDFGAGASFGEILVDRTAASNSILTITLNSSAITAINTAATAGSIFVLGGQAGGSAPVPVSTWAILCGFAFILMFTVWRFIRKQQPA
jgi:hypothetical protein